MVLADVGDGNCFALRTRGINAVVSKGLGHRIEFIQELIATDPKCPRAVLEQRVNEYPAQTARAPGLVLKHFERIAVVPVQPIL